MDLVAELLAWIGFGLGIPLAGVWLLVRLAGSHWERTEAVVIDGALRWMDRDGRLRERALEPWEADQLAGVEHPEVLTRGGRARLLDAPTPERPLRVLTAVFLALGALAFAGSFVLGMV